MSRTNERLEIFKIIFSSLYQEFVDYDDFILFVHKENPLINNLQIQLMNELFKEKENYIQKIQTNLKDDWTWERLGKVEQTVLLISLAEAKTWKTTKAVIINEAIVTIKKYGVMENYRYINAILDKILE